jgi:hypothetical protein
MKNTVSWDASPRLLVTANIVPISRILSTLKMEATRSSEK